MLVRPVGGGALPRAGVGADAADALLTSALARLNLSARACHRVLKIACTIADLAGAAKIEAPHLSEAVQYRSLDRGGGA